MALSLTNSLAQKLAAVIEVLGLLILLYLYTATLGGAFKTIGMGVVSAILACSFIYFFLTGLYWSKKPDHEKQKATQRSWHVWVRVVYLLLAIAVVVAGVVAALQYRSLNVLTSIIILTAGLLGGSLSEVIWIRLKHRQVG